MPRYEDTDDGWRICYVVADQMTSYYRGLQDFGLFYNATEVYGHAFYRSDECTGGGVNSLGFNLPGCYGTGVWNASTTPNWSPTLYLGGEVWKDFYNDRSYNYYGNIDMPVFPNFDPDTILNHAYDDVYPQTGWQTTNTNSPPQGETWTPPVSNGFQFMIAGGPITVEFNDGYGTRQWCTGAYGTFQGNRLDGDARPSMVRLEILSPSDAVLDTYYLTGYEGNSSHWSPHEDTGILQTWSVAPIGPSGVEWGRYDYDGSFAASMGTFSFRYTGRCGGYRISKMSDYWWYGSPVVMWLHEFGKRTVGEGPPQRINRRNDSNGVNDKAARFRNLSSTSVSSKQSSNRVHTSGSLYE